MMYERKIVEYTPFPQYKTTFILVGDVGGTNSNFGIFATHDPKVLFVSYHYKSKQVKAFEDVVADILEHLAQTYMVFVASITIAVAGVVLKDAQVIRPTNLLFVVDKQAIAQKTGIKKIVLVNDFLVIGYGIDVIDSKSIIEIQKGNPWQEANKAILGAGTGLGKSVVMWDKVQARYHACPSEGGHGDCAVQLAQEFACIEHIKKHSKAAQGRVSWEDVLSGSGIQKIYNFFNGKDGLALLGEKKAPHPDEIFNNRNKDESCQNTVQLYTRMYARCAKNYALDTLALGGLYIAGGIAAKNIPLFQSDLFLQEFLSCDKQHGLLVQIPIFVIADYNISLYGAAAYSIQNT